MRLLLPKVACGLLWIQRSFACCALLLLALFCLLRSFVSCVLLFPASFCFRDSFVFYMHQFEHDSVVGLQLSGARSLISFQKAQLAWTAESLVCLTIGTVYLSSMREKWSPNVLLIAAHRGSSRQSTSPTRTSYRDLDPKVASPRMTFSTMINVCASFTGERTI